MEASIDNLVNNKRASEDWLKEHGFYEPNKRNKRSSLFKDLISWEQPMGVRGDMMTLLVDASYTSTMQWLFMIVIQCGRRNHTIVSLTSPNVAEGYFSVKEKVASIMKMMESKF